jgi:predicted Zn-ribbon and HTH transcriptional regulator
MVTNMTRRQEIVRCLCAAEREFDDLRRELGVTVAVLEEDLRHIGRSAHGKSQRLVVRPARCESCDFAFKSTALHPPGRCPSCRDRRIFGPWLRIERPRG